MFVSLAKARMPATLGMFGCLLAAWLTLLAAPAEGAVRWVVKGAGWGHGIGMSQYGAYGYALRGVKYRQILGHYYTGTSIGEGQAKTVRVLLKPGTSRVEFAGGRRACGRLLEADKTYAVTRKGSRLVLRSASGRALRTCGSPLRVGGYEGSGVLVAGLGRYRGRLELRTALSGGINLINAVGLESYVKGVVPNESPSKWPLEALKAQAVAARTYALATGVAGVGFDQYADVRSQVYRGMSSEKLSTNFVTDATRGEVVLYGGQIAVTYFFSTSGGRTENIELAWPGSAPKPWLKSVKDPYDDASPHHRWGPLRFSRATMQSRLSGLVKGRLLNIRVAKRGNSPRIVHADIVGSDGTRRVTGGVLRTRLKLRDTWAYFTKVVTGDDKQEEKPPETEVDDGTGTEPIVVTDPDTGGQEPGAPPPDSGGLGSGGTSARQFAWPSIDWP